MKTNQTLNKNSAEYDEILKDRLRIYAERLLAADAQNALFEIGQLHAQLGETHDELERYEEAEAHYSAAATCFFAPLDEKQITRFESDKEALILIQLGEIQALILRDLEAAIAAFNRALAIGDKLDDNYLQAYARYNLSRVDALYSNWESVLAQVGEAESILRGDHSQQAGQLRSILVRMIATAQAEIVVQQAFRIAQAKANPPELSIERRPGRTRRSRPIDGTPYASSTEDSPRPRWLRPRTWWQNR